MFPVNSLISNSKLLAIVIQFCCGSKYPVAVNFNCVSRGRNLDTECSSGSVHKAQSVNALVPTTLEGDAVCNCFLQLRRGVVPMQLFNSMVQSEYA